MPGSKFDIGNSCAYKRKMRKSVSYTGICAHDMSKVGEIFSLREALMMLNEVAHALLIIIE